MLLLLRWSDLHYTSTSINNRLIGWLILEMPVFAVCVSSEFLTYRCGRPFWSFHQFCSKSSRFGVFFYSSSWIPKTSPIAIWIYTCYMNIYKYNIYIYKLHCDQVCCAELFNRSIWLLCLLICHNMWCAGSSPEVCGWRLLNKGFQLWSVQQIAPSTKHPTIYPLVI